MKTITDIREQVEHLETMDRHARMETEKKYKGKIFKLYEDVPEINKLTEDLENMKGGYYEIDQWGDLIYSIDVPKHIKSLPEIGSYLTREYFTYKDGKLSHFAGEFITVNWSGDSRSYFVFDHDTQKPIIADKPKTSGPVLENYVRAKIELYMRQRGVFNDVVETDYYGGYVKHFEMKFPEKQTENLEVTTDEELQEIIEKFEEDLT